MAIGKADERRNGDGAAREVERDELGARKIRADSDDLLSAVRELQELEAEKRGQEISSPAFHATAREITERAREVFRRAAQEEKHGAETGDPQERTTEDVPPARGIDTPD